jgi:uracil-DNA glycosylase family 4
MSGILSATLFDLDCRRCPRLAAHLDEVKTANPSYYARPVAPFGDENPRLLIVGLAPGMHGANRTGRPFTGDYAGILLYETLYQYGFATAPTSLNRDDGLRLMDCRITNAVKCLPPENKPETEEIKHCNSYLLNELKAFSRLQIVLALGNVAHAAVLRAVGVKAKEFPFGHGFNRKLPTGVTLYDSYHCSRYNTQTRRLTPKMFQDVFAQIKAQLTD